MTVTDTLLLHNLGLIDVGNAAAVTEEIDPNATTEADAANAVVEVNGSNQSNQESLLPPPKRRGPYK